MTPPPLVVVEESIKPQNVKKDPRIRMMRPPATNTPEKNKIIEAKVEEKIVKKEEKE